MRARPPGERLARSGERGRAGGNFTIITLLLAAAAWWLLVASGPGQAAAGQVARQGRAPVQWSRARPRLCGLQQISLALVTGTAQLQVTQTPPQAQDWFHSGQAARLLLLALPEKWPTRNEVYYQVAWIR